MRLEVVIDRELTQIRKDPNHASKILNTLGPSATIYNAIRLFRGWYFLEELDGWAEVSDVRIVKTIDPYDPNEDYSTSTDPVEDEDLIYDPEEVVKAVNKATTYINSLRIIFKQGDKEEVLHTILANVTQAIKDMQEAVNKIAKLPDIPSLPKDVGPGVILTTTEEGKLEWRKLSMADLVGLPESDERYANEF